MSLQETNGTQNSLEASVDSLESSPVKLLGKNTLEASIDTLGSAPVKTFGSSSKQLGSSNAEQAKKGRTSMCRTEATHCRGSLLEGSQKPDTSRVSVLLPITHELSTASGSGRKQSTFMSSMAMAKNAFHHLKQNHAEDQKPDELAALGVVNQGHQAPHSGTAHSGLYNKRTTVTGKDAKAEEQKRRRRSARNSMGSRQSYLMADRLASDGSLASNEGENECFAWLPVFSCFDFTARVVTVLNTLIAAWSGYIVPLHLAFNGTYRRLDFMEWDDVFKITQALDVVYFMCVISSLRIAYIDEEFNEEVHVPALIAWRRLTSWSFWLDLASCVPITLDDPVAACLKISRCYRLLTVSVTFQHLQFRATIQIGRMVGSVVYASHLVACLWYWIIYTQDHYDHYLEKNYAPSVKDGEIPAPYLTALRDAVFMMFNRPVAALNDMELVLNIAMAPVGSMVIAIIFGNINWLFQRMNARSMKHFEELSSVEQALNGFSGVPSHLAQRIMDYFRYLQIHHDNRSQDMLLKGLSPTLLLELKLYLYSDLLLLSPFFTDPVLPNVIKAMVMVLSLCIYSSGDFVIHRNEPANAMYFIVRGSTEVLLELDSPPVVAFAKGQYFGEMALFRSVDSNAKRTAWVRAVSFCHLARLTRKDFEDILDEFPEESPILLQKIGEHVVKEDVSEDDSDSSSVSSSSGSSESEESDYKAEASETQTKENQQPSKEPLKFEIPVSNESQRSIAESVDSESQRSSIVQKPGRESLTLPNSSSSMKSTDSFQFGQQGRRNRGSTSSNSGGKPNSSSVPFQSSAKSKGASSVPGSMKINPVSGMPGALKNETLRVGKSLTSHASGSNSTTRKVSIHEPGRASVAESAAGTKSLDQKFGSVPKVEIPDDMEKSSNKEIISLTIKLQSQLEQRMGRLEAFMVHQAKYLNRLSTSPSSAGSESPSMSTQSAKQRLDAEFEKSKPAQETTKERQRRNSGSKRRGSSQRDMKAGKVASTTTNAPALPATSSEPSASTPKVKAIFQRALMSQKSMGQALKDRALGTASAQEMAQKNERVMDLFNADSATRALPKGLQRQQTKTLKRQKTDKLNK